MLPPKLRPEFTGMSGPEIRDLIQQGVSVKSDPEIKEELSYTGDTSAEGLLLPDCSMSLSEQEIISHIGDNEEGRSLLHLRQAFRAPIILCELTFLDSNLIFNSPKGEGGAPTGRGHMHLDDVVKVVSSHGWDKEQHLIDSQRQIVFFHLSERHGPATRALELILLGLPEWLLRFSHVAITSLLSKEELNGKSFPIDLVEDNGSISLAAYKERINDAAR